MENLRRKSNNQTDNGINKNCKRIRIHAKLKSSFSLVRITVKQSIKNYILYSWSDLVFYVMVITSLSNWLPWPGNNEETFSVFESSYHLPTCLQQTVDTLPSPMSFLVRNIKQESCEYQFLKSLV